MKEENTSKPTSINIEDNAEESVKPTPLVATLRRIVTRAGGCYLWPIWILSVGSGALLTTQAYVFGQAMEKLAKIELGGSSASPTILFHFLILGGAIFFVFSLVRILNSYLIVNAVNKIRCEFFRSILKQDISFHDSQASGAISSQLAEDSAALQNGILLMPEITLKMGQFFAGIIWAFCASWFMALILLACSPFVVLGGLIQGLLLKKASVETPFANAFGMAADALSSIRTTISLNAETTLFSRFEAASEKAVALEKRKAYITALAVTYFISSVFCGLYGLGFFVGEKQIESKNITIADFSTCFFAFIFGAMALGEIASMIPQVIQGLAGAHRMLELIDRKPTISITGQMENDFDGEIEFRNVSFAYPTRKEDTVLKDFSVKIKAGETVALVGPSGCGKSTIISLLERFYDPLKGIILVDGIPISSFNLDFFRSQISLVSQEPVLFNLTIKENILLGGDGDFREALDMANADFVSQFANGIDTMVGEKGAQLSGGQKQRIAIARAMIGKPRILLLDEATSALDSESEAVVQQALDKVVAKSKCTTIMIAHRLSTVKNADRILVIDAGKIVEQGTHNELVELDGKYASMVATQSMA